MKIFNNGIYFKQTDEKEDGYYTEDHQGNLIHHKYEKPTFWQRAKYFAKYGYEMNLETISTSYLHFYNKDNEVCMGLIVGDAITTAKNFKKKRNFGSCDKYVLKDNTVYFETSHAIFQLDFQDDGLKFKMHVNRKNDNKSFSEIYTFLNWDNI